MGTVEDLDASQRSHSESVGAKLEAAARWDLLDLGMRNPLLNYRLLRSRGSGLQGHAPQHLIDALYGGSRAKGLCPGEQAQPEVPEIQSEESTATIVGGEVPGPTPVRQVPEYQTVLLSLEPKEKDLASASRASLVRWGPVW